MWVTTLLGQCGVRPLGGAHYRYKKVWVRELQGVALKVHVARTQSAWGAYRYLYTLNGIVCTQLV